MRAWILGSMGMLSVASPVTGAELVNCSIADMSAAEDEISRPFYITSYPGVTLEQVTLWFVPTTPGAYSYTMTVRESTYNGAVLGQATANYTFTSNSVTVPVVFDFGRVLVASGSRLTFTMEQTAGSGATYYEIEHAVDCPLTETEDNTAPLSTVRDDGVYALIFGETSAPDTTGNLETPTAGSALSGVVLFRGWVCDAKTIEFEMDANPAQRYQAVYGADRPDTESACGDSDNGYALLINVNELGDGAHSTRVLADGVQIGSANFTVQTLGVAYLTGASGNFTLQDFPAPGGEVDVTWVESLQNFMINGHQ